VIAVNELNSNAWWNIVIRRMSCIRLCFLGLYNYWYWWQTVATEQFLAYCTITTVWVTTILHLFTFVFLQINMYL